MRVVAPCVREFPDILSFTPDTVNGVPRVISSSSTAPRLQLLADPARGALRGPDRRAWMAAFTPEDLSRLRDTVKRRGEQLQRRKREIDVLRRAAWLRMDLLREEGALDPPGTAPVPRRAAPRVAAPELAANGELAPAR